jgi:hypothetical protein
MAMTLSPSSSVPSLKMSPPRPINLNENPCCPGRQTRLGRCGTCRRRPSPVSLSAIMTDQVPSSSLELPPLRYHEFHSLPGGFEYQHEISEESNSAAFDLGVDARDLQRCVICGNEARRILSHPLAGVQRVHIIDKTEGILVRDCFMPSYLNNSQFCIVELPEGHGFCSFSC